MRGEGLGESGGASLQGKGGRVGFRKVFFNGKEGRGDFRKNPSLRVREDWWVFEKPLIMAKKGLVDFLNKIPLF